MTLSKLQLQNVFVFQFSCIFTQLPSTPSDEGGMR